jgi:predicted nucleic acid-binding protein
MIDRAAEPLAYIDTNVFIFFFEGAPPISERVKSLFDAFRNHPGKGITSELTLAEVFAESQRPRPAVLKRAYLDLMVWNNFIELVPVSRDILYDSVDLRAIHRSAHGKKLDLPDAIHLATAIQRRCKFFISGDDGIRPPIEMAKLSPVTGALNEVMKALR